MSDSRYAGDEALRRCLASGETPLATTFVLKIAERCNLNCSYCYMYNKGDTSYLRRPKFMAKEMATAALERIASYAARHKLPKITLALHGGEPLLIGQKWVQWFLEECGRAQENTGIELIVGVQTNGTLLDAEWLELLNAHRVTIGISSDGPEEWNDLLRIGFDGRGSYRRVRAAIELLAATPGTRWGVLTVVNPSAKGSAVLQHLADLGVQRIDFIWPDFNHDHPPPWPKGTLARYFCELFDYWYDEMRSPPRIRFFESAMSLMLGGASECDALGLHPVADIIVESDGTWEPLDTLRICGDGITRTGLDVRRHEVEAIWESPLYQMGLHCQELMSAQCQACACRRICGGGYLPHRYRRATGIANPSVYCADLLELLTHIGQRIVTDLRQAGILKDALQRTPMTPCYDRPTRMGTISERSPTGPRPRKQPAL